MGSSQLLLCSSALWLVVLASASLDMSDYTGHVEQRQINCDPERLRREMQKPDHDLMQTEMDLSELLQEALKEFGSDPQTENPDRLRVSDLRPIPAMPRSITPYPVRFPLARPSADNIQAICSHSAHRPRYPQTYFPSYGYGQLRRRATAVNNGEFWFNDCCRQNATWGSETTLCCATQAWVHHVKSFCEDDSSVKDKLYKCCRKRGSEQLNCFHNDAPNPNYDPTEELPVSPIASNTEFRFEPSTCPRAVVRGQSSLKVGINFPLGRPTADNIQSICQNKKLRPLYSVKCLVGPQYKLLARQAKSINRMEKGFKLCCKKEQHVLNCAEEKWREELNQFCAKQSRKKKDDHCCSLKALDRFKCFQDSSHDPHYNVNSTKEEVTPNKICEAYKLIKKKIPAALPLKAFVNQCCPLPDENKAACFEQKIRENSGNVCSSKKNTSPALRRCCHAASEDVPECLSKLIMNVTNKVAHAKKKKICPLLF